VRRATLAEGEATGHAHVAESDAPFDVFAFRRGDRVVTLYLRAAQAVRVLHEEHRLVTLQPGLYEIARVLERDWLTGVTREVVD
jgi:hypothetical protein